MCHARWPPFPLDKRRRVGGCATRDAALRDASQDALRRVAAAPATGRKNRHDGQKKKDETCHLKKVCIFVGAM